MSRSLKKGPYVDEKLLNKIKNLKAGDKSVIKTWARNSTISPEMVGFTFGIHNGRKHIEVFISEDMCNLTDPKGAESVHVFPLNRIGQLGSSQCRLILYSSFDEYGENTKSTISHFRVEILFRVR